MSPPHFHEIFTKPTHVKQHFCELWLCAWPEAMFTPKGITDTPTWDCFKGSEIIAQRPCKFFIPTCTGPENMLASKILWYH